MRGWLVWVLSFLGIPETKEYDSLIRSSGLSLNPALVLAASKLFTLILFVFSLVIPVGYWIFYGFSHPLLVFPSVLLFLIYFLECFGFFDFSPLLLLFKGFVSWRRIRVEMELPYAMLFLNQLLSLGVPLEIALRELKCQPRLKELMNSLEGELVSQPIRDFSQFISQCKRGGASPTLLEDLVVVSGMRKRLVLSRFRALSSLARQIFTYLLLVCTASVLFLIVSVMNSGSVGLEFLLLDVVNPFLFGLGFFYLVSKWAG